MSPILDLYVKDDLQQKDPMQLTSCYNFDI